jgi:hypothetical protein
MVFSSGGVTDGRCFISAGLLARVFWKLVGAGSGSMDGQEIREFVFMTIYCVDKPIKKNTSGA